MRRLLVGLAAVAAWACSDSTTSTPTPPAGLHFVVQGSTAPPLYAESTSFWARYDQDREARMYYQGATPSDSGEELLRFTVPAGALAHHPDGSGFAGSDSILITIKADTSKFIFTFEPSGLKFDPLNPARLHIEFNEANPDFDDDGVVNAADSVAKTKLLLWRREPPDTSWISISTLLLVETDEIEGPITSFTEYAVAW